MPRKHFLFNLTSVGLIWGASTPTRSEPHSQSQASSMACMLTTVHAPDYLALAARLTLQRHFALGPKPTFVVVFDDKTAVRDFCDTYSDLCEDVTSLSLAQLLGPTRYDWVKGWLNGSVQTTGSMESTKWLESTTHVDSMFNSMFNFVFKSRIRHYPKPCESSRIHLHAGLQGRIYQSIKKIYGALGGPSHCRKYFLSDSESLPFRLYHWQHISAPATDHYYAAHWYDIPKCSGQQDYWRDPSCGLSVAKDLGLMPQELRTERFWQQNTVPDQFWFWDRSLVHDLVSEVESTMRMPFAWAFLSWRWSDAGIYNFWVIKHVANSTAAGLPPLQQLRNLPVEIQRAMPAAHQKCCQCSKERKFLPCHTTYDLLSPCMLREEGVAKIASFMRENIKLFASWLEWTDRSSNAIPFPAILDAGALSWCVNNCFNKRVLDMLMATSSINSTFASVLASSPLVVRAFEVDKRSG